MFADRDTNGQSRDSLDEYEISPKFDECMLISNYNVLLFSHYLVFKFSICISNSTPT